MTVTQDITNTAIVQAVDLLSRTVTATDTAFVDVRASALQLAKVGSARAVRPGTTVIYTYTLGERR
ncbi:MAG: hypothetical protein IPK16_29850 [Anaerolineales bacterium]|nr:hypothetical protein [Anaerolineales bacterium]